MSDKNIENPVSASLQRLKFDLHMHTLDDPFDNHVYHTVFELIDKAASLQFNALAITLHTRQFQSEEATDYAKKCGIFLIPGVEQDIEGVHVLLLNFPKNIADSISSFAELRKKRKELVLSGHEENLVIAPHPFFPSGVALNDKFWPNQDCFDAVEVSGFYHPLWNPNKKGIQAAQKLNLPLVGNSDTHTLEQFGTTWSEINCEPNVKALILGIKAGKAKVMGRPLGFMEMGLIAWKVIARGYMKWINYKKSRKSVLK